MPKRFLLRFAALAASAAAILFWASGQLPDGISRAVFLNVGQGDAFLFRGGDGATLLVDGGPDSALLWETAAQLPFLERRIDLLAVTHPNADHFVGFLELLERIEVRQILLPAIVGGDAIYSEFLARVRERGIPVHFSAAGDLWQLGKNAQLAVLFPPSREPFRARDENDAGLFLRLEVTGKKERASFLLTGDAGIPVEKQLLASGVDLRADVLKVGHHGSKNSSSAEFLEAVAPAAAVISVGENSFGHPAPEALSRLGEILPPEKIFRTDRDGTIGWKIR